MGVIETHDLEPAPAGASKRVEMILRVDKEPRRHRVRDVARGDRLADEGRRPNQEPAALPRRLIPGVGDNVSKRSARELNVSFNRAYELQIPDSRIPDYSASMTIAMPMPPPMQSEAIP